MTARHARAARQLDVPPVPGLSARTVRNVLAAMAGRARGDGTLRYGLSGTTLAELTDHAPATVHRARSWLVEHGYVERVKLGGGRSATLWRVCIERLPLEQPATPKRPARARAGLDSDQHRPDPDGNWSGRWPLQPDSRFPPKGKDVVYVLRVASGLVVYVGSTSNFSARMKAHHSAGKRWASWTAQACDTREDAYDVENEFLQTYMPHLNEVGMRQPGIGA